MRVRVRELKIPGAFEFTPTVFGDDRGLFTVPFAQDAFVEAVGHPLRLGQTNHSVSSAGVIRGVHFADVPPGQAKYVYCPYGALLDVLVDLRVGSPTFGVHDAVRLDADEPRAIYVPEGIGHAFVALADHTVCAYLCSTGYNPAREHGVHPLDPALELPWPADIEPVLSNKDRAAPTLADAESAGLLPSYADCQRWYAQLRESAATG